VPKVLAHTVLAPGHTYPFLSVLIELQRRGFTVTMGVSTSAESVPEQIAGVRVTGMRWHAPERVPTNQGRRATERVWLANLARTGEPLADTLGRMLAEERPDFLLIDPMLWGAMVAAEASGLPWASLSHNPLSIRGRGLDVRGPGRRPTRGALGRFRDRVVDFAVRMSSSRSLEIVNALRVKHGLGPLADYRDRYLAAPLIIAATAEPFEYPRSDWPSSLAFVGPLAWEPAADEPKWLGELGERPLVLLVGSTEAEYRTPSTWIRRVFEALADEPIQVVATLPTDEVPEPVPSNVLVQRFVPHRYLLARAKCVICHGGYGITAKALAVGVPVLAIPLVLDRFEVARRVDVAGAGVMLSERHLTRERVKAAVRTTIARKAGAERIAEAFRRAGGSGAAADAIESVLAKAMAHV
jgi:MGT family glycosyltransferase